MDAKLTDYIYIALRNSGSANIIIAGCSCSGKTTLAEDIKNTFENLGVTIIHEDDYFKDLKELPRNRLGVLADSIGAFHVDEYMEDCSRLLEKGETKVPVYDKSTNTRIGLKKETCGRINVFEGLHAISILDHRIRAFKIFMMPSYDICLNRRIERDMNDWHMPADKVRDYWYSCILPVTKTDVEPQKKLADVCMNEEGIVS